MKCNGFGVWVSPPISNPDEIGKRANVSNYHVSDSARTKNTTSCYAEAVGLLDQMHAQHNQ